MAGLRDWDNWKKRNPLAAGTLGVLPVTGQVTAGLDYASAMREGNSAEASMAALGFIPGFRLGKYASGLAPAGLRLASKMSTLERAIAPVTKNAPLVGRFNDGGDAGQAGAQMYNNAAQVKQGPTTKYTRNQP